MPARSRAGHKANHQSMQAGSSSTTTTTTSLSHLCVVGVEQVGDAALALPERGHEQHAVGDGL